MYFSFTVIKGWDLLLQSSANKNSLISFLADQWQQEEFRNKLDDRKLIISTHNTCKIIRSDGYAMYDILASNQEEADGKLVLHVLDASND